MTNEAVFLQVLGTDPQDTVTRAVYADWLEERGEADRAEFLRLQLAVKALPAESQERQETQKRLGLLRTCLDSIWLRLVDPLARLGEFSRRALSWANRLGVKTVGDLCELSAEDIIRRSFIETVLSEYRRKLAEQGLRLRDD